MRPALVVEVADAGLRLARGRKAAAYARAGIADYWIVNLVDRVLEIYRVPVSADVAQRRLHYSEIRAVDADASITPLAAPGASIHVAELLP
jgi:Uma2 family endonuclease